MCGIVGVLLEDPDAQVNQMLFDALTVLQHRGQDAAGMVVTSSKTGSRLELRSTYPTLKTIAPSPSYQSRLSREVCPEAFQCSPA
jgi:glucosamine 6-phosphate synthetase-like amidotransferase/phosphosugar isomerase protein